MPPMINGRIAEYLYYKRGAGGIVACNEMERQIINIMASAIGGDNTERQKMALNLLEEAVRR